jgi:hypothetical protein
VSAAELIRWRQTLFKTMLHQLMTGQIRVNAAG